MPRSAWTVRGTNRRRVLRRRRLLAFAGGSLGLFFELEAERIGVEAFQQVDRLVVLSMARDVGSDLEHGIAFGVEFHRSLDPGVFDLVSITAIRPAVGRAHHL